MENIIENFSLWLQMRGCREETIEFYLDYLKNFLRFSESDIYAFWSSEKFEKAYIRIFKRDVSANTKKKYLITARIFSDFLIKKWIIEVNYAREMKAPRVQTQLPFALTRSDILGIYNAIDRRWSWNLLERNRLIFDTFIYTWLRRWELSNLRRENIFEDRIIVKNGKWGKDRIIYIPKHFSQRLQKFIKETDHEYLFYTEKGNKIQDRTYHTIFTHLKEDTGIRVHPHVLRHTYASNCIQDGIDIYTVQLQLGHTDIKTTSMYLYINSEQRSLNMQKLT